MIALTGSTKKQPPTEPADQIKPSAERRANAEMERLRQIILGETTERVEDISRQVTSREVRVRRLVEDMPEAITKNTVDQSSLTRLASALRVPIEEALGQSVRGDQHKLAEILAPALARALPRTLASFLIGLPLALSRRAIRVVCPWLGRRSGGTSTLAGLGRGAVEHPFQVDRVCLFQKGTFDVLRTCDVGFDDDATQLEVDHLFVQLSDALRSGSPNPSAGLRYPTPGSKAETQSLLILEGDHTLLAAYCKGQPAHWLRDRLQDLADEANGLAQAMITESAAGQDAAPRLQSLDALLKKALVCYVPAPQPTAQTSGLRHRTSWFEDAAVITCIVGIVWVVATVARATTEWNKAVYDLDAEAGIVVTDHSWIPGRSITGLRDPLAPDPAGLLSARGYKRDSIKLHFTSFLSDEAPFKEQRQSLVRSERDSVRREISSSYARALALMEASLEMHAVPTAPDGQNAPAGNDARETIRKELLRTLLELPSDTNFDFKSGTVTIPASLPRTTRTRIREVIKAIPWVKELNEADLPVKTTTMRSSAVEPVADASAIIQTK